MDVTVVIPTRRRPELLGLTLRTVLWQQRVQGEVVIVDDGNDMGTRDAVARLKDDRIRLIPNSGPPGVGGARNCGIAVATGAWIAFLDDDDLWAPTKLEAQIAAAAATGAAWAYCGDVVVDSALRIRSGAPPLPPDEVVDRLRRYNAVPAGASNVVVRREVLDRIGGFDTELQTSEDWDLWLRLAATGLPACVPRPLVALRTHPEMASRRVDQVLADIEVIASRYGIPVDRARHLRWAAWLCLEDGRRGEALHHYGRAVMEGDVRSAARALVAVFHPGVARRGAPLLDDWAREAQAWIAPLHPVSPNRGHAPGEQRST